MEATDYPMHKGARTSLYVVAGLLVLLCVTIPFAVYVFIRVRSAKVRVTSSGLTARGLMTTEVPFDQVERAGVLRVPLVARGLGAVLARMKLDNMDEGVNLVFRLRGGKDVKVLVNQFENHRELVERVRGAVRVPLEDIKMGTFGWKWPERQG